MEIYIINGPNLELLGKREPELYGHETLSEIESYCQSSEDYEDLIFTWLQSSSESKLIEYIHGAVRSNLAGIIINPAAYSHTSVALLDALQAFQGFVIEVHLTNVHKREIFRQTRLTAKRADAVIEGLGKDSYRTAMIAMKNYLKQRRES